MEITAELLKEDYPEIVTALVAEGQKGAIENAKKEGAAAELARIKSVQEQTIPGHEVLIAGLMFDGVTTGDKAAVQVLAAEKEIRAKVLEDTNLEAPKKLPEANTDLAGGDDADKDLPVDERCKKAWDKSKVLQAEFDGDFDAFLAYEKATEQGLVKVLRKE